MATGFAPEEDPFGLDVDDNGPKGFFDGTHRLVSPADTLRRTRPLMPVMGITRLANLTGLDTVGLPVVMAVRPNARSLAVASGKGLTVDAAMASGLMESIELYHAERPGLPLQLATFNELRHAAATVDIERLPRLSLGRFHDSLPILWNAGFDLMARQSTWVPHELVHANFTLPLPTGSGCFAMTSNGLASGNHVLEAISHALCEIVERDAAALWHVMPAARKPARRVALDTVQDAGCREALARLERADLAVGVWDISSDIGLPVIECVIVDRDATAWQPAFATSGTGCHPCRDTALLRAVTEAAQGRLIYIAGSRDDRDRAAYRAACDRDFTRDVRALVETDDGVRLDFRALPTFDHASFAVEVRWILERLADAGVDEVVVVDLTRREFQIPVVRVIVPGLEGVDGAAGYLPGPRVMRAWS